MAFKQSMSPLLAKASELQLPVPIKVNLHLITPKTVVLSLVALLFLHRLGLIVYRIFFHPLRNFPGPFLAKFTTLYELYYDIPADGKFCFHCEEYLHPKYGPIVRTGPNRLRILGIEAFSQMNKIGTKFVRDEKVYNSIGIHNTMFTTPSNEDHRQRRSFFVRGFSRKEILKCEPFLKRKIERGIAKIREVNGKGAETIDMGHLFMCQALEVYTEFMFGVDSTEYLDFPGFHHPFAIGVENVLNMTVYLKHFSWLFKGLPDAFPPAIRHFLFPKLSAQSQFSVYTTAMINNYYTQYVAKHTADSKASKESPSDSPADPTFKATTVLDTIFDQVGTDGLPPTLYSDIQVTFSASFSTISWAVTTALTYIARTPTVKQRLFDELKSASPNKEAWIPYSTCETLPYLMGTIKETLRLSFAVPGGLSRISPPVPTPLCDTFIPPSTAVEVSIYSTHLHPSIFPSPHVFRPERWLPSHSTTAQLNEMEHWMIPFGGGAKICLGMHMANLQLYLTVANVVRRFEVELNEELMREGVRWADKLTAAPRCDLRVKFLEREE